MREEYGEQQVVLEDRWRDELREYALLIEAVLNGDRLKVIKLFGNYILQDRGYEATGSEYDRADSLGQYHNRNDNSEESYDEAEERQEVDIPSTQRQRIKFVDDGNDDYYNGDDDCYSGDNDYSSGNDDYYDDDGHYEGDDNHEDDDYYYEGDDSTGLGRQYDEHDRENVENVGISPNKGDISVLEEDEPSMSESIFSLNTKEGRYDGEAYRHHEFSHGDVDAHTIDHETDEAELQSNSSGQPADEDDLRHQEHRDHGGGSFGRASPPTDPEIERESRLSQLLSHLQRRISYSEIKQRQSDIVNVSSWPAQISKDRDAEVKEEEGTEEEEEEEEEAGEEEAEEEEEERTPFHKEEFQELSSQQRILTRGEPQKDSDGGGGDAGHASERQSQNWDGAWWKWDLSGKSSDSYEERGQAQYQNRYQDLENDEPTSFEMSGGVGHRDLQEQTPEGDLEEGGFGRNPSRADLEDTRPSPRSGSTASYEEVSPQDGLSDQTSDHDAQEGITPVNPFYNVSDYGQRFYDHYNHAVEDTKAVPETKTTRNPLNPRSLVDRLRKKIRGG